jgi:hypothetical protein
MNENIEGMEPDIRDVVRVVCELVDSVFVEQNATDDFNVITLSIRWSLEPLQAAQKKPKPVNWKVISGAIGAVGTVAIALMIINPPPPPPPPPIEWTSPPEMPWKQD